MTLFESVNAFSRQIIIAGMVCFSALTKVLEETIFLPTNWLNINQLFTQKRQKSMIAVRNSMSFQELLSIASSKFYIWYVSVNIRNISSTLLDAFNISIGLAYCRNFCEWAYIHIHQRFNCLCLLIFILICNS